MSIGDNQSQVNLPTPSTGAKRKRGPAKERKATPSIKIELDVLPHGLGRKGDLLDRPSIGNQASGTIPVPLERKRILRGNAAKEDTDTAILDSKVAIKSEDKTSVSGPSKSISAGSSKADPVTVELLDESLRKKSGGKTNTAKFEEDVAESKIEDLDEPPKKKRATRKKNLDVSEDVLDKVNEMVNASRQLPKKEKKKANKYGLTPGKSPFPEHIKPTAEDCEEVNRLLSKLHGEVKPPDVIPPPSMEVAGCGEVPDLLDAILRTLLSASTTANNANLSLQGLKDKFHLRESGIGKGSINWEAVHRADLDDVIVAIKSGGLAKVKGTNIKKILDVVYEQNCARRDAFLEEKQSSKEADIPGAKNLTTGQKEIEITKANENMLSMDHLFEMTTDEAMEEMTKLPGIGVKTASCVILFCMKRPSFAVDTHVWRHCKWLGWVPGKATRDQTFSHCEVRIPDHLKYSLHQLFLKHGKTCGRCRANTSAGTEDWDSTECPIDHLVKRTEEKKTPGSNGGSKSGNKSKGNKKGTKGKEQNDETEESDIALHDEANQSGSEYDG